MPRVYNKYHKDAPKDAIYVGRPSKCGNPFVIGKDGNREEVIAKYKKRVEAFDDTLRKEWLVPLIEKDLVCWCTPKACHADVLLEIANS